MTVAIDRTADGRITAAARVSPTLWLAIAIGVIAIVGYRTWWSVVFVAFAGAIALMDRRRSSAAEIIRMALAVGVPPALALVSLLLVVASQYTSFPCSAGFCPRGASVLLAGVAFGVSAAVVLAGSIRYLRRHGRWGSLLPALVAIVLVLFITQLLIGPSWSNTLVELGALAAAAGVLPIVLDRPGLVRAAALAQVADLGTFGFVWQAGQGEANPVAGWILQALFTPADGYWTREALVVTGLMLIVAKLALIAFLIRATPYLGRYSRLVLFVAAGAGMVGAAANVLVLPVFA